MQLSLTVKLQQIVSKIRQTANTRKKKTRVAFVQARLVVMVEILWLEWLSHGREVLGLIPANLLCT